MLNTRAHGFPARPSFLDRLLALVRRAPRVRSSARLEQAAAGPTDDVSGLNTACQSRRAQMAGRYGAQACGSRHSW